MVEPRRSPPAQEQSSQDQTGATSCVTGLYRVLLGSTGYRWTAVNVAQRTRVRSLLPVWGVIQVCSSEQGRPTSVRPRTKVFGISLTTQWYLGETEMEKPRRNIGVLRSPTLNQHRKGAGTSHRLHTIQLTLVANFFLIQALWIQEGPENRTIDGKIQIPERCPRLLLITPIILPSVPNNGPPASFARSLEPRLCLPSGQTGGS